MAKGVELSFLRNLKGPEERYDSNLQVAKSFPEEGVELLSVALEVRRELNYG